MHYSILVTGITGFIGLEVANHFLRKGYKVIAPIRRKVYPGKINTNLILCDYKDLFDIVKKNKIEFIYHFASLTSVNHDDQNLIYKTNIYLAELILKISDICRPKMIVFSSTISIYGKILGPKLYFENNIKNSSVDSYGKSKLISEKILSDFCFKKKIKLVIFRLPGVIGYRSHSNLISKILDILRSDNHKEIYLKNPTKNFNNLIDIDTFIEYLETITSNKYNNFEQINTILACKEPIQLQKLIELIIENLKLEEKIKKRIKWKSDLSNTFTIDSEYQKRFYLNPVSTKVSINRFCKNILNGEKNGL